MFSRLQSSPALLAVSTIAAGSALVVYLFDPVHYSFYPTCYFHLITEFYCPGCGALRATHQLLHGHFAEAARLNLLVVLSLPASAVLWSVRSIRPLWIWILLGSCAVFTVARNLPGGEWLSP
jgi:hypothetical protein